MMRMWPWGRLTGALALLLIVVATARGDENVLTTAADDARGQGLYACLLAIPYVPQPPVFVGDPRYNSARRSVPPH
jgi:hypothetical protein